MTDAHGTPETPQNPPPDAGQPQGPTEMPPIVDRFGPLGREANPKARTWAMLCHLAGLIAVMPLTSLIVLLWLYSDHPGDSALLIGYCEGALLGIVPTILFFVTALLCFRRHLPLWAVLSAGFAIWLAGAFVHQWFLRRA